MPIVIREGWMDWDVSFLHHATLCWRAKPKCLSQRMKENISFHDLKAEHNMHDKDYKSQAMTSYL